MTHTHIKTLAAAAAFAVTGVAANAATVASLDASGNYALLNDGTTSFLGLDGDFSLFLDSGFDTMQTQDFLLEVDLSVDGTTEIDEELVIAGVTGDDLLFGALSFLASLPTAIIDELQDGDLDETEIAPGLFFGFDVDSFVAGTDTLSGGFQAILTDGVLGTPTSFLLGDFEGSIAFSTIAPVPLPASFQMLALAGMGMVAVGRRRRT